MTVTMADVSADNGSVCTRLSGEIDRANRQGLCLALTQSGLADQRARAQHLRPGADRRRNPGLSHADGHLSRVVQRRQLPQHRVPQRTDALLSVLLPRRCLPRRQRPPQIARLHPSDHDRRQDLFHHARRRRRGADPALKDFTKLIHWVGKRQWHIFSSAGTQSRSLAALLNASAHPSTTMWCQRTSMLRSTPRPMAHTTHRPPRPTPRTKDARSARCAGARRRRHRQQESRDRPGNASAPSHATTPGILGRWRDHARHRLARRLGCVDGLRGVETILRYGPSYQRQRAGRRAAQRQPQGGGRVAHRRNAPRDPAGLTR